MKSVSLNTCAKLPISNSIIYETTEQNEQTNYVMRQLKFVSLTQIIIITLLFFMLVISWTTLPYLVTKHGTVNIQTGNIELNVLLLQEQHVSNEASSANPVSIGPYSSTAKPATPINTSTEISNVTIPTIERSPSTELQNSNVTNQFSSFGSTKILSTSTDGIIWTTTERPSPTISNCTYKEILPNPPNDSGYVSVEKKFEELSNITKVNEIGVEEINCKQEKPIYKSKILFNKNKTTAYYCEGLAFEKEEAFRCGLYNTIQYAFSHKDHVERTLVEYDKWLSYERYLIDC